jgi:hypothetical protein
MMLSQKLLSTRCACLSHDMLKSHLINFKYDISLLGCDVVSLGKWFLMDGDMMINPNTANHKTNNAASHTHSSTSTKTSKYCIISIALKQSYVGNWIKIITCNAILLTHMWDTGLCTVRMSRSVDNCVTQGHLNLTFEHTKTLLHQYYVLWYLERTPALYSPCTVITLFTALNFISAPYRIWQVQKTFVYLQYPTAWHVI